MKIEQLIVQYLYINKQVTLQGIGTFKLDPSVVLPGEIDKEKDFLMPEKAFEFDYNLKAGEDEGLVKYIVQHTRKILPLASSDLESYSMLAKQFLNIGKPLVIDGVGTVQKNQQGDYQFVPGVFITPKIDDIPKQVREKRDESISFESEKKVNNSRRNLVAGISALVIILIGLGVYYVIMNKKMVPPEPIAQAQKRADTVKENTAVKKTVDTIVQNHPDSVVKGATPIIDTDSSNFKIVLKTYPDAAAVKKAFNKLTAYGHKLVIVEIDSLNYELAMPFTTSLSDTLRAKDSLKKFFGGNPYVKF